MTGRDRVGNGLMWTKYGDKSKQPPGCYSSMFASNPCHNLKETGGGMDGERYTCEVCKLTFFLDYDEMR